MYRATTGLIIVQLRKRKFFRSSPAFEFMREQFSSFMSVELVHRCNCEQLVQQVRSLRVHKVKGKQEADRSAEVTEEQQWRHLRTSRSTRGGGGAGTSGTTRNCLRGASLVKPSVAGADGNAWGIFPHVRKQVQVKSTRYRSFGCGSQAVVRDGHSTSGAVDLKLTADSVPPERCWREISR